jgi:hypothetical protein
MKLIGEAAAPATTTTTTEFAHGGGGAHGTHPSHGAAVLEGAHALAERNFHGIALLGDPIAGRGVLPRELIYPQHQRGAGGLDLGVPLEEPVHLAAMPRRVSPQRAAHSGNGAVVIVAAGVDL